MAADNIWSHIKKQIQDYEGDARVLESAIGAFYLGTMIGWRPLMLIHSVRTYNRYQKVLNLKFRDHMPERGSLATKSRAMNDLPADSHFWKAVRGDNPGRSGELVKVE